MLGPVKPRRLDAPIAERSSAGSRVRIGIAPAHDTADVD